MSPLEGAQRDAHWCPHRLGAASPTGLRQRPAWGSRRPIRSICISLLIITFGPVYVALPLQMASHTPTAEPPAGQSVPPRAAAACAPAAHGVGELCAYSPAGRPPQNIASLMLGRRLPVRVEAATGMGEKSVDSVPYLILYSTCEPADCVRRPSAACTEPPECRARARPPIPMAAPLRARKRAEIFSTVPCRYRRF